MSILPAGLTRVESFSQKKQNFVFMKAAGYLIASIALAVLYRNGLEKTSMDMFKHPLEFKNEVLSSIPTENTPHESTLEAIKENAIENLEHPSNLVTTTAQVLWAGTTITVSAISSIWLKDFVRKSNQALVNLTALAILGSLVATENSNMDFLKSFLIMLNLISGITLIFTSNVNPNNYTRRNI